MANENDSAILIQIWGPLWNENVHLTQFEMIERLERYAHQIKDDSTFWLVLVTAWVDCGGVETQDRFRALMSSDRRNRHKGMKGASRRAWRKLPDPVLAYRALRPDEDPDRALAWSLDVEVVRRLYLTSGRRVEARTFPKSAVVFYTDRRREREIIVLDASVGTVVVSAGSHAQSRGNESLPLSAQARHPRIVTPARDDESLPQYVPGKETKSGLITPVERPRPTSPVGVTKRHP